MNLPQDLIALFIKLAKMRKNKFPISNFRFPIFNIKSPISNSGFGLIEVTVSIYIITMGLFGLMSLVSQSLKIQNINKNTIIAAQLAQEGIELVRNIRDNNWRNEYVDWHSSIFTGTGVNKDYIIDYRGRSSIDSQVDGITDSKTRLNIHNGGTYEGFYTHSTTDTAETSFSRIIEVEKENDTILTIKCIVFWEERNNPHKYTVETKLYNWKFPS